MRSKVVIFIALVAIAVVAGACHEMVAEKYSVRADGTVLNAKGEPAGDIEVKRGAVLRWCNETDLIVVIKTDGSILGGKEVIRLRPGECIDRRVLSGAATADYETQVVTEDGDEEGQGGGTIKVGEDDGGDD
jgi:hypothetical protein